MQQIRQTTYNANAYKDKGLWLSHFLFLLFLSIEWYGYELCVAVTVIFLHSFSLLPLQHQLVKTSVN